ncbi:helix-turn-helix transcriptional regulator, partial [Acinetobacter baumannii]
MTNKLFLFSCEHEDISIVKMEQVASHLVGLLRHSNMTRSEIALQLGWKKSRVTKVLSGEENLTIKTISKISRLLGYDFDVIFHNKNYERPKQPWQIDRERKKAHLVEKSHRNKTTFLFDLQTGQQVVEDVLSGNEKEFYISVNSSRYNNGKTINIVAQEV